MDKFNKLYNLIMKKISKCSSFQYVDAKYLKKYLDENTEEIIKNNPRININNVLKYIKYPYPNGKWLTYMKNNKIYALSYITEKNNICFINQLVKFISGGNVLLNYILNECKYDLVYLTADWSQKDSLNDYYRRKEFNLTEYVNNKNIHYFYRNKNLSKDELDDFLKTAIITESVENKLIVVDIQPAYAKHISFDVELFVDYLNNFNGEILYLFNGPDYGYEDQSTLINWLFEYGLNKEVLDNITFKEKVYGYIRDFSDYDEEDIQQLIKYMYNNKLYDSRDIVDFTRLNLQNQLFIEQLQNENICGFLDPDLIDDLRDYNNTVVVGGGQNECLWEIEQFLQTFNINYTENKKFIY